MEWYTVLFLILLLFLFVTLGIVLACILNGQRCSISIQQRTTNHELTRKQQDDEEKRQKKISNRFKHAFSSSDKPEEPLAPVEDIKTVELTFKLGDDQKKSEQQVITVNEPSTILLEKSFTSPAEREARRKRREELKRKYNL